MNISNRLAWVMFAAVGVILAALVFEATARPDLFTNVKYVEAVLLLEIMAAAVYHYEAVFFPLLIGVFLWAGMPLPLEAEAMTARWIILGVGAWVGLIIWLRERRRHYFGAFHLIGLSAVLVAFVSTLVSGTALITLSKAASLFLLLVYGSGGARVALDGRETEFVRGLLLSCDVLTCAGALSHIVIHYPLLGGSNAVGALMALIVIPVEVWDLLVRNREDEIVRYRRIIILLLACVLLYQSRSRASILAACVATVLVCVILRRRLFLLRVGLAFVFLLAAVGTLAPAQLEEYANEVRSDVLYKGKSSESGVWLSRRGPWDDTVASIRRHPWFGSGFGTSDVSMDPRRVLARDVQVAHREHGNSYLAIAEYMGLVGIVPFGALILLLLVKLLRTVYWLWSTGNAGHPYVPITAIVAAGLAHAFFEDWLFAPGNYLCVFFWSLAFTLMGFLPLARRAGHGHTAVQHLDWSRSFALPNSVPNLPSAR